MILDRVMYSQRNEQLCESVANFLERKAISKLHIFLPIQKNNEPDITSLLPAFWSGNIQVVVSKTDFMFKQMRHYLMEEQTALIENRKGIPEPVDAEEISIEDLDLIFVPLLLSDRNGFRVGYGGGYYDRLLKETKALKVGLSLSPPVDEILQTEDWDVPLDYLITPFKTYNYG